MRVLFVRHGETEENSEGIIQGQGLDECRFTERGLEQISKLVERLKEEKIDLIISSDFLRCKQTGEEIAKKINLEVEYSKELREKNEGDWVGKKTNKINWDGLEGSFETRRAPKGESLREVRERGRKFFSGLLERYKDTDKTILIVSHATFLRILIGDLVGLSLHDSIFKFSIENCSLSEIDVNKKHEKGFMLKFLNENNFLA